MRPATTRAPAAGTTVATTSTLARALVATGLAGALAVTQGCKRDAPEAAPEPSGTRTPGELPAGEGGGDDGVQIAQHPTAADALRVILRDDPAVIGFGEFHQRADATHIRSAIARFTAELLPVLGDRLSDIVVETWVQTGACGAREQAVSREVAQVTERPAETEDEIVALANAARKRGIQPHALELGCDDYEALRPAPASGDGASPDSTGEATGEAPDEPPGEPAGEPPGEVDYGALLDLVKRKLAETTARVLAQRREASATTGANTPEPASGARSLIAVYGGSLHNDRFPRPGLEDISYAPDIEAKAAGGFIEVDLFVPEFIRDNPLLVDEPWYPRFERLAGPDRVLLIRRGPRSYALILRTGVAAPARPEPPTPTVPPAGSAN